MSQIRVPRRGARASRWRAGRYCPVTTIVGIVQQAGTLLALRRVTCHRPSSTGHPRRPRNLPRLPRPRRDCPWGRQAEQELALRRLELAWEHPLPSSLPGSGAFCARGGRWAKSCGKRSTMIAIRRSAGRPCAMCSRASLACPPRGSFDSIGLQPRSPFELKERVGHLD